MQGTPKIMQQTAYSMQQNNLFLHMVFLKVCIKVKILNICNNYEF